MVFLRDVYEKMKRDLRMSKDEQDRIASSKPQQERSLSNLETSLQGMLTSKVSHSALVVFVNELCCTSFDGFMFQNLKRVIESRWKTSV